MAAAADEKTVTVIGVDFFRGELTIGYRWVRVAARRARARSVARPPRAWRARVLGRGNRKTAYCTTHRRARRGHYSHALRFVSCWLAALQTAVCGQRCSVHNTLHPRRPGT